MNALPVSLLTLALLAPAAQAASLAITPAADVRSLRQISLRFDTPMVALGQGDAAAPAQVRCTHPNPETPLPKGAGRWASERDWVFEFSQPLPAGTRCEVQARADLRSRAGEPVGGTRSARFRILPVAYHGARTLTAFAPGRADYAMLLAHPAPAGGRQSLQTDPFVCDVLDAQGLAAARARLQDEPGAQGERPAGIDVSRWLRTEPTQVLDEAQVRAAFPKQVRPGDRWALALRCSGPLPDGAKVRLRRQNDADRQLVRGSFAPSDAEGRERFAFDTRAPFTATLACEQRRFQPMPVIRSGPGAPRSQPQANEPLACDARLPIELRLSVPVHANLAKAATPRLRVRGADGQDQLLQPTLTFTGPQRDQVSGFSWRVDPNAIQGAGTAQSAQLQAPGEALRDPLGRPLANPAIWDSRLQLLPPPAYLGAVAGSGAIAPLHAPDAMRRLLFATRGLEPELALRQWHIRNLDDGAQRKLAAQLVMAGRAPQSLDAADWARLQAQLPTPKAGTVRPADPGIRFTSVPLAGPGLHVAQVRSTVYDQQLREDEARQTRQDAERARADQRAPQPRQPLPERPGERWNVAQLSNLAVTANLAEHGESLLWVTAIDSAKPLPHARVWLYDCKLQPLWQGQADAQGVARVPADSRRRPWRDCSVDRADDRQGDARLLPAGETWVRVQAGDDLLLAPLPMRPHGWADSGSPWQAHLVQDRSLLQAGETLHLQLLARKPAANGFDLPEKQAVQLSIFDETNELVAILPGQLDEQGQLSLTWTVPANAKLGHHRVVAELPRGDANATAPRPAMRGAYAPRPPSAGTVLAETAFRVEEFRRPVFDAGLRTAQTPGSQRLQADGRLAFFSGGSAQGEAVSWQHRWSPAIDEPVPGYTFFTPTRASDLTTPPAIAHAPSQVDADGAASGALTLPRITRPWRIESEMRFADPNGETQTVASAITVWPTAQRIGLRWEGATASQPGRVAGVLIDEAGKPIAGRQVQMQLARAKAIEAKDAGSGESRHWQATEAERPLCTARTDASGRWSCPWPRNATPAAMQTGGDTAWLVRASLAGQAAAQTALVVNAWQLRFQTSEDTLTVLNGPEFQPGERAQIEARPRRLPASLLLTTEREGVRSHQVLALQQMKQHIALPLTAQDAPNVHVRAQYVYPWQMQSADQQAPADGPRPAAMRIAIPGPGVPDGPSSLYSHQAADLQVSPAGFALTLDVQPAQAKVLPGTALPVRVQARDAQGRPASGARFTVAVVDEALLALSPNESTRVFEAMWRARANGVGARTLLGDVAVKPVAQPASGWIAPDEQAQGGAVTAEAASVAAAPPAPSSATLYGRMAKAADSAAGGAPDTPAVRKDFASLLLWQTQVHADARGQASLTVPVNDGLTRFRIVAIATQGTSQFGQGQASFEVSQPLQILPGLPELVRAGDDLMQKLTLRNTEARPLTVDLRAQAQPVASDDAPAPRAMDDAARQERGLALSRQVTLAPGGTQTVLWRLRVPDGVSRLDWQISAQAHAAQGQPALQDAVAIQQRVVPAIAPTVRSATLLQLGAVPSQLDVAQPTGALPRVGGVRVGLAASLVDSALQETRRWMRDYPYACLEQQSSRAVVLDDRAAWDRLVAQLPKYLDQHGLARFFPEPSLPGSEMLTLQLLDLSHATGWAIPPEHEARMLQAARGLVEQRIRPQDWAPRDDGSARLLAAQATLAEHGQPRLLAIPEDLSALPSQSLIDWARTLAALPPAQRPGGAAGDPAAVSSQLRSRFDVQGSVLRWRDEAATQWWWFMWSGDATAARMALLAQQLGATDALWQADAPRIVQGLVARQQRGRWYSTGANAWSAVALNQFARQREAGPVSGASVLTLGQAERRADWQGRQGPTQLLPWPQQGGTATLGLRQDGGGQPWATVATVAAVPLTAPAAHGLAVQREVLPIEQRQPGRWSVGDAYRVRLTVTANAPQTWVVVRDALPSGATPLNRGLGRDSQLAASARTDGASKAPDWRSRPSFEEHAADSYRAYYRWVGEGTWQLEYTVRLNNAGTFTLPPTRVEALYAPEVFGETPAQAIEVRP